MFYLAFDIGGSSIKIGVLDKKGNIFKSFKEKTPKKYIDFKEILRKYIIQEKPQVVCFSSPGSVNSKTYEVLGISAIPYIHKHNFVKEIKEEFNVEVSIENDANCSALGEVYFDKKYENAIFLTIGTGIGGAIIFKGELLKGFNNEAGEFGYIKLTNSKTLSNYTLPNTLKRLKKKYDYNLTTYSILNDYFIKKEPAYSFVKESFDYLEMAIYNLRYIFDPEVLIIGGAISEDKRYIKELQKRCPYILIKACKHYNSNNLLGALAKYLQGEMNEKNKY